MKKTILLKLAIFVLATIISNVILAQSVIVSPDKNSLVEYNPRIPMTSLSGDHTSIQSTINYFDGLGRPTQTILHRGGGTGTIPNDIVSTQLYDAFGRPYQTVMSAPSTANLGTFLNNASSVANTFYNDANPYSEVIFEDSPINTPLKSYGVGQAWRTGSGHFISNTYGSNTSNQVRKYTFNANSVTSTSYDANTLYRKESISEQGSKTIEFTDRQGRILERHIYNGSEILKIAYVYNDLGQVAYVIPPKVYDSMATIDESLDAFKEGAYGYRYDSQGRIIERHTPGGGWVQMVYNKRDLLILTQSELQRTSNKWSFNKYDALNRIILTGEINDTRTLSSIQAAADAVTTQIESTGTNLLGYTNSAFPSSITESNVRTVNYYDNYSWANGDTNFSFENNTNISEQRYKQDNAPGFITGTWLKKTDDNTWKKTVMYYDNKARVIQVKTNYTEDGDNRSLLNDTQYSFVGEILKNHSRYSRSNPSQTIFTKSEYSYDHIGRKTIYSYGIGATASITVQEIARYSYDAVGRMIVKKIKPGSYNASVNGAQLTVNGIASTQSNTTNGTIDALQTIDYEHNIRGGLRSINGGNTLDATQNDLFALQLTTHEDGRYYDGNISSQQWLSKVSPLTKSYIYTYDPISRLTDAKFTFTYKNGDCAPMDYSVSGISYDKNGNIMTMQRKGDKTPQSGQITWGRIDGLDYTYLNSYSNKLKKVSDLEGVANPDVGDFRGLNTTDTDYEYDVNGNLIVDRNKGISEILYDTYLNLPTKITLTSGKSVMYWYDAAGAKQKKTTSDGATTSYMVALVFEKTNNIISLSQAATDEGRVIPNSSNGYDYEYYYTDHLGNLRLSFKEVNGLATVVTETVTDPWGLILKNLTYNSNPSNTNKFDFTGKERQNDYNLNIIDFGARMFQPELGRWMSIDLLADKYRRHSPYSYSINNPLKFTDPNGMEIRSINGGVEFTGNDAREFLEVFRGSKVNVAIDINGDHGHLGYAEADRKVNYTHWAMFTVSNIFLAKDVLSTFGDKSIKNLVFGSHGVRVRKYNSTEIESFKFRTDDISKDFFTISDLKDHNEGIKSNASIDMLQKMMSKVADRGNFIFAVCYLGQTESCTDFDFAEHLGKLSGNRFNMYTFSGFTTIWRFKPPGSPAIAIGNMHLEPLSNSEHYIIGAYWNHIVQGQIQKKISQIILNDSTNPVQIKK